MTQIPDAIRNQLKKDFQQLGDLSGIQSVIAVGGGCIHNACRVETKRQSYMLKWNPTPAREMFLLEQAGLELLRQSKTVRVPQVYTASAANHDQPAYILMEWIEPPLGGRNRFNQRALGEQLAALHRRQPPDRTVYGLDYDNYVGQLNQYNSWMGNWIDFFREKRLGPQIEMGVKQGRLTDNQKQRLDSLSAQLVNLLGGVNRRPALLHGDLWAGNVIAAADGEPVLLDPAVYYGDRETDLAFTEMFGGFEKEFYEAYQAAWPLEPGYDERKHIYNLYHLLNHLNHFGQTYGPAINRTLDLFVA